MASKLTLFPIAIHASLRIFGKESLRYLTFDLRCQLRSPQKTDKQTNKVNQSVELYVRTFCNYEQDDWQDLLPLAKHAYNNPVTTVMELSPFYANKGYHSQTNWPTKEEVKDPASKVSVHYVQNIHELYKKGLETARE